MPALVALHRLINPDQQSALPSWVLSPSATAAIDPVNNRAWSVATGVITADAALSVSRASSGYAWSTAGVFTLYGTGTLRRSDLGAIIENAATNVTQQNTDISNAAWTKTSQTATPGQTGPDPANATANLLTNVVAASAHTAVATNFSFLNATAYVTYAIGKVGTDTRIQLTFPGTAFTGLPYANFDLSTGAVVGSGGTGGTSGVVSLGGGWVLCYLAATSTAAFSQSASNLVRVNAAAATRAVSYTPAGADTVIIWLPGTETGSFPTSPIPNPASASATRAADNVTPASAFQTAMDAAKSAYIRTQKLMGSTTPRLIDFAGTASLRIAAGPTGTTVSCNGSGSTATATIGGAGTTTGDVRAAFSFDGVTNKAVANGGTLATAAGAWGVTTETPTIGNSAALTNGINGYLEYMEFSNQPDIYNGLTT